MGEGEREIESGLWAAHAAKGTAVEKRGKICCIPFAAGAKLLMSEAKQVPRRSVRCREMPASGEPNDTRRGDARPASELACRRVRGGRCGGASVIDTLLPPALLRLGSDSLLEWRRPNGGSGPAGGELGGEAVGADATPAKTTESTRTISLFPSRVPFRCLAPPWNRTGEERPGCGCSLDTSGGLVSAGL